MESEIIVPLNSFVHRVHDKLWFSDFASNLGCGLKRIRRSRHWILFGKEHQLTQLRNELSDDHYLWVKQAIDKALPKRDICLAELIECNPNITLNQLMTVSGCTISEARLAIDAFESLDLD